MMPTVNNTRSRSLVNLMSHNVDLYIHTDFKLPIDVKRRYEQGIVFGPDGTNIVLTIERHVCKDCGKQGEGLTDHYCSAATGKSVNPTVRTRPKSWDWCETEPTYEELQEENERLKNDVAAQKQAAVRLREKLCKLATQLGHDVDELLQDIKEISNAE